eukprot:CAMPEP_0169431568 /NCGR_PEP_ID=MMETSP1042-20121227/3020_1 /TAXON_ID=464988 /ORGANISM="Hemiselmis andersenii, Strain CCMP1180" /LENGTH=44 /DNA_ID= /DNA_START= /DNA_END= /DNA_ORIENTATION=
MSTVRTVPSGTANAGISTASHSVMYPRSDETPAFKSSSSSCSTP